jgi:hypothetical protein
MTAKVMKRIPLVTYCSSLFVDGTQLVSLRHVSAHWHSFGTT